MNASANAAKIYSELCQEISSGTYDHGEPFPASTTLAERFGVSRPTLSAVLGRLTDEGFLIRRPGLSHEVTSPAARAATEWAMTGRYARARAAQGLVFAGDTNATMEKRTIDRRWGRPSPVVDALLGVDPSADVFMRQSRTYVDGVPVEDTLMHFPAAVVADAPELEIAESIRVVELIEATGRVITRTENRIVARHATQAEIDALRLGDTAIVFEWTHVTFDAEGQAVEAVTNVKPANRAVLVFHTWEGPDSTPEGTTTSS